MDNMTQWSKSHTIKITKNTSNQLATPSTTNHLTTNTTSSSQFSDKPDANDTNVITPNTPSTPKTKGGYFDQSMLITLMLLLLSLSTRSVRLKTSAKPLKHD